MNQIIFGIPSGKFISSWKNLRRAHLLPTNLPKFNAKLVEKPINKCHLNCSFEQTSSCVEPRLHIESHGHVVYAFINDKYLGKLHLF